MSRGKPKVHRKRPVRRRFEVREHVEVAGPADMDLLAEVKRLHAEGYSVDRHTQRDWPKDITRVILASRRLYRGRSREEA